jgi:anti-anti-sigma factor
MSLQVIITERAPGVLSAALSGSLDANTHMILDQQMESALKSAPKTIVIDMENLKFISSIGLRVIAKIKKALKESGGTLMLVNLQPQIKEVFNIINALPQQQIFSSIQELDDYLLMRQQQTLHEQGK